MFALSFVFYANKQQAEKMRLKFLMMSASLVNFFFSVSPRLGLGLAAKYRLLHFFQDHRYRQPTSQPASQQASQLSQYGELKTNTFISLALHH